MNKILLGTVLTCFIACQNQSSQPEHKTAPVFEQSNKKEKSNLQLALNTDPVCGMSVADGYADTTIYEEKIYGFCGSGCKDDFLSNPSSYLK